MIVADTNLVSYLLIQGRKTEGARKVWSRDPEWRLPPLWRSEFLNVLVTAVGASVLSELQAFAAWTAASRLFLRNEVEPEGETVLRTAIRYRISAYDAQFVAVAAKLGAPLVTADARILKACPDLAVSIEGFAAPQR